MCVCMCIYMYIHIQGYLGFWSAGCTPAVTAPAPVGVLVTSGLVGGVHMCMHVYICIYVCIYVCMYIYIYMYICIYVYICIANMS